MKTCAVRFVEKENEDKTNANVFMVNAAEHPNQLWAPSTDEL